MTHEELWFWHAYDYGWRRVYLRSTEDNSPLDPGGKWIDVGLIGLAQEMYRRIVGDRSRPRVETAKDRDAAAWRQRFAEEHGFNDFGDVMRVGIARVAMRRSEPAPQAQEIAQPGSTAE